MQLHLRNLVFKDNGKKIAGGGPSLWTMAWNRISRQLEISPLVEAEKDIAACILLVLQKPQKRRMTRRSLALECLECQSSAGSGKATAITCLQTHPCTQPIHMHSSSSSAVQCSLSRSPSEQQSVTATAFLASHRALMKKELLTHLPHSKAG